MSTILKALRRLEQEGEPPQERALREQVVSAPIAAEPAPAPASRMRRGLALARAAVALAALAFLAGRARAPGDAVAPPAVSTGPAASAAAPAAQPAPVASAPSPWTTPGSALPPVPQAAADEELELDPESPSFAVAEPDDPDASRAAAEQALEDDLRALAERARAGERAISDSVPEPSAVPPAVAPRRADVLASPSPRRDLDAPSPAEVVRRERFDEDAPTTGAARDAELDSVPIARRRPATPPAAPAEPAALKPRRSASPARESAARGTGPTARAAATLRVTRTVWHPDPARRLALMRGADDESPREVREGDQVDGWAVRRIEPSGVVLERDGVEARRRVGEGS